LIWALFDAIGRRTLRLGAAGAGTAVEMGDGEALDGAGVGGPW
jgi:hypothetical protein